LLVALSVLGAREMGAFPIVTLPTNGTSTEPPLGQPIASTARTSRT
jgi:hypothetical protein